MMKVASLVFKDDNLPQNVRQPAGQLDFCGHLRRPLDEVAALLVAVEGVLDLDGMLDLRRVLQ